MHHGVEFTAAASSDEERLWCSHKNAWKNKTVELNVGYSVHEMEKIKFGFVPRDMDDKWFIYYAEDEEILYLHRSWTGFCVFMVKFKEVDGGFAAMKAVAMKTQSSINAVTMQMNVCWFYQTELDIGLCIVCWYIAYTATLGHCQILFCGKGTKIM